MKKSVFLGSVLLAALLTLSALAHNGSRQTAPGAPVFSSLLDVSEGYMSYAFAEQGKTKITWKEIKSADLTIDLRWDISKIIRKTGTLVLSSADAGSNRASTLGEVEDAGGYAIYVITSIARNPAAIGRDKITYGGGEAFVNIGTGNEWSKDGYTWNQEGECRVTVSTEKQTVYVRGKGNAEDASKITLPSVKTVRVNIPAMPKTPKVNIYPAQGFLSARAGMEISNDGEIWARMTKNTIDLGAVTRLPAAGGGSADIDLGDGRDVYIRRAAEGGRPPSDAFTATIKLRHSGEIAEEHFTAAPGRTVLIDNAIAAEAFIGGKWKKVKSLTESDIPESGLRIRRAGAKDRMAGPESVLRLIASGGGKVISVSGE
jgi:hypothetical protein